MKNLSIFITALPIAFYTNPALSSKINPSGGQDAQAKLITQQYNFLDSKMNISCGVKLGATLDSPMTIDNAIRLGVNHAPSHRVSIENLNRLKFLHKAVENNWHPRVTMQLNENLKPIAGMHEATSNDKHSQYGISLVQDLNFSKLQIQREQAMTAVHSEQIKTELSRQIIASNIVTLYLNTLKYKERLQVSAEHLALLKQFKQVVGLQHNAGAVSSVQVQKLEVAIQRSEIDHSTLKQLFLESIGILAETIGVASINDSDLVMPLVNIQEFSGYDEDDLIAFVMNENLSLKQLRKDLKSAQLAVQASEWTQYPRMTLQVQSTRDHRRLGKIKTNNAVKLNVNYSLWDGGASRNTILAKNASRKGAIARIDAQELALDIQTKQVFSGYKTALSEAENSKSTCAEMKSLLSLQKIDFSTQTSSKIFDLVSSSNDWFTTANRAIDAHFNALNSLYQIKSLGSGI